jgi:hypothetical protein
VIYLVTLNHNYNESAAAFGAKKEALEFIRDSFGIMESETGLGTDSFWQAVCEHYEAHSWKGAQFLTLDPNTLEIEDVFGRLTT